MRAVVQRVNYSFVDVEGQTVGRIGRGYMALLGAVEGDTAADADYIIKKIAGLRIFEDENGKMNLSVRDVGGSVLLVSQFTLAGDARHGNRPSFSGALEPESARQLCDYVAEELKKQGIPVETGVFRAHMEVTLLNDGPVTILLDSRKEF
ncbi:MAG: D-tyrosyl-tRNA(Tyr) deacylase [Clostridiales bacterium]|nr:D-tyrosyl-tRNA(Tyr) deacylase [Clostridiales bacterium]